MAPAANEPPSGKQPIERNTGRNLKALVDVALVDVAVDKASNRGWVLAAF
jgi:hypothetical protein